MKPLPFLLLLLLGTGCLFKNTDNSSSHFQINHSFDTILISLPKKSNYHQGIGNTFFDKNNHEILCLYDSKDLTIDFFSLDSLSFIRSLLLKKHINNYGPLNSFYVHDEDSVICLFEKSICIINSNNEAIFNYEINNFQSDNLPQQYFKNYNTHEIYYKDNNIYLPTTCYMCPSIKDIYHVNRESKFNIYKKEITPLNILYPKEYTLYNYGFANAISRVITDSLMVYNFNAIPDLFVYTLNGQFIKRVKISSKYSIKEFSKKDFKNSSKYDSDENLDNLVRENIYEKLIYDKYRQLFYRFVSLGIPLKNEDLTYNDINKKPIILQVIDSKFNLIKEINLGAEKINPLISFGTKNGIIILLISRESTYFKKFITIRHE
ncbi:MAG: hypothetical protein KatS3mg035_1969 [Bacteroidia bacterium]|nr:MAG: hypothetical protein KatS3mg035_1969 [Bacteroidia bacterium]